ncbi:uncharacterized protein LOC107981016 [Nasonia vitripennis]|uniref:Uncharacterized protein n=1 Tax=Nasonia vitripennis TaxID=7425 RepID=A0A7M7J372_NASVI|nr:uncharacterized protein LOC107981016 [Nasonia vitripennis]
MITMLLIGVAAMSYVFWKININNYSQPSLILSTEEFKNLVLSIVDEDFERLFSENGSNQTSFLGELQLLDDDYRVLWSKNLDDINLRYLDKKIVSFDQKSKSNTELFSEEDDYSWEDYDDENASMIPPITPSSQPRGKRSDYVTSPSSSKPKKYVVSHQTRFVNCERFKPTARGKYLVSPSLPALHTCYKNGVYLNELEQGITRNQDGELRYDLENLYVACRDVFNNDIDVLTNDLLRDYERCKWSQALDSRQEAIIEHRFADKLRYAGLVQAPGQLQASTTTTSTTTSSPTVPRLDPRGYVECNHVETELFEDYFESPSYEALQRCQKHGVTAFQLRQGIGKNPKFNEIYFDVSSLYVPCSYVFDEQLDYLTKELKEDYRRCKSVDALSREAQQIIEKKFHEALNKDLSTEEKSKRSSSTSTEDPSSSYSTDDDYDSSYSSVMETTTIPSGRYAFANCKRAEGSIYMICIKVIKVYSMPMPVVQ